MPTPDPDASDWSDLDLLTVSEATERLDEETEAVRRQIAALTEAGEPDEAALAVVRRRLILLDRARERARTATVTVATGRVRTRAEVEATPGPPD
jgi:hypothetical protein